MRQFNINRPGRRTFDQWIADFEKLSGKRDVSGDDLTDAQVQAAFAEDPQYAEPLTATKLLEANAKFDAEANKKFAKIADQLLAPLNAKIASYADQYALAEAAEGRHREDFPNDPTET